MTTKSDRNSSTEKVHNMDSDIAIEILQDMYFIQKLFEIQRHLEDIWLRDYYTKLTVSYLSIVLHECIQAKLLDKEKSDPKAVRLLASIRQRIIKLVPDGNSSSMKKIMESMGIDFDHYCFDLQISLNEVNANELFDVNFTHYDMLGDEEMRIFDSLIKIPLQIIEGILMTTPLTQYRDKLIRVGENAYSNMADSVAKQIALHKYPYASGVFFKYPEVCKEDKILILYYYTLVKQALMLDTLVPEYVSQDVMIFNTTRAKCKLRAIIIENLGQFLKKAQTPLSDELRTEIGKVIDDQTFFSKNRSIKNNVHYKKITVYELEEILTLYKQQQIYLEQVMRILLSKIKCNVGWRYKIIRFIADKTDSTMIEARKKNKSLKRLEDVSVKEWEEAENRLNRYLKS